jgi:hypothetical protein
LQKEAFDNLVASSVVGNRNRVVAGSQVVASGNLAAVSKQVVVDHSQVVAFNSLVELAAANRLVAESNPFLCIFKLNYY